MANVLHSGLTGTNLHKPLGAKEVGALELTQTSSRAYAIDDNDHPNSDLIRIDKTTTTTTSVYLGQFGGTRANVVRAEPGLILPARTDPGSQAGFNRAWVYGKDVSGTTRLFTRDESGEHQLTPPLAATDVQPAFTEEAVPMPMVGWMGTSVGTRVLSNTAMECACWWMPRPFTFNRVIFTSAAVLTGSPTITIQFFQYTDGAMFKSATAVPLVLQITAFAPSAGGDGTNQSATVSSTTLREGWYYTAIGRDSGGGTSYTIRSFVGATNANWFVPAAGSANFLFTSGTPASPSSSLDLTTVAGSVNNQSFIHRFKFV